jgi:hypothetical protein
VASFKQAALRAFAFSEKTAILCSLSFSERAVASAKQLAAEAHKEAEPSNFLKNL